MKVIYGEKYTEKEGKLLTPTIYSNIMQAMSILIEYAIVFGIEDQVIAKDSFNFVRGLDDKEEINLQVGDAIKELWADPGIQAVWNRRSEFQIIESVNQITCTSVVMIVHRIEIRIASCDVTEPGAE